MALYGSLFIVGLFSISLAREAYFNEFNVSSKFESAGDTHATMYVLAFPPRESYKSLVNLLSRYGMWIRAEPLYLCRSLRREITFPRTNRLWFIDIPSSITLPTAWVFLRRSLPAKSTKWNLAVTKLPLDYDDSSSGWAISKCTVKIAWDLELLSFMLVVAVVR